MKPREGVYRSPAVADGARSPVAQLGSGSEGSRRPAGQNPEQKDETSGLSNPHAPFRFWCGGPVDLSIPAMEEKRGSWN